MIEITLSFHEIYMAALIGVMRRIVSLKQGHKHRFGNDGSNAWEEHIEGACGEVAFAKAVGKYWDGSINRFGSKGGDVGDRYQVRTRSKEYYDLYVRPEDADDKPYVLVIGRNGKYKVYGWMYGRDAKQEKWLKEYGGRRGAYFVPKEELQPLDALP